MLAKTNRWIFVFAVLAFVVVVGALSLPARASATQAVQPAANSCLTCHENQYYLYDSGKLYCLTDHTDRCTNCHAGNAATAKKEESHLGLVAHPQENNGEKCQECHTAQIAQERLAVFASQGGFSAVRTADVYTPAVEVAAGFPDVQETTKLPWMPGAFVVFGFWLTLVLFTPLKP
jgi:hypothetical protein